MTKVKPPPVGGNPASRPNNPSLNSVDDVVVLDDKTDLAIRPKNQGAERSYELRTSSTNDGIYEQQTNPNGRDKSFLVSFNPPAKPVQDVKHVPCDIVLVIDVSGSMGELAPLPDVQDEKEREKSGLTVLDLVRHSCKTILSTLNENDRLAVVTFSQSAKVVTKLQSMTKTIKDQTVKKIESLKTEAATNLWAGITLGLQEFEKNPPNGNVQGLYILTDGMPNFMCPQPGYVPKLKPLLDGLAAKNGSTPTIHTFGFGFSIRSDLMLSIAETGNGSFAFIPDVGMIGTIFIHAVANLYTTFATNATLEISCPGINAACFRHTSGLPTEVLDKNRFIVKLGSIHYGQSRDITIYGAHSVWDQNAPIQVQLKFDQCGAAPISLSIEHCPLQSPSLSGSELDYHYFRNKLCENFAALYPVETLISEHKTASASTVDGLRDLLFNSLVKLIASQPQNRSNPDLMSLLSDLVGPNLDLAHPENGQINQALSTKAQTSQSGRPGVYKSYWEKWGCHYLSSLWCAHMRQACNSFKDAGPLRYGVNSTLFQRCKAELDKAFDELPPPTGTYVDPMVKYYHNGGSHKPPGSNKIKYSMSSYNRSSNPCMLGNCRIKLSNGELIKMEDLRVGMSIQSPLVGEARKVVEIVKSFGGVGAEICRVRATDLWITGWHPVYVAASEQWKFPIEVAEETRYLKQDEAVYSVVLSSSSQKTSKDNHDAVNAHAVEVEGIPCVTLGHGVTSSPVSPSLDIPQQQDVRAHPFFGNYRTIERCLKELSMDQQGRRLCGGLIRDSVTGLACGVLGASAHVVSEERSTVMQMQDSHNQGQHLSARL